MDLTQIDVECLEYVILPCSRLKRKNIETERHTARLAELLESLKTKNKVPADAHLISGAGDFSYDYQKKILVLEETALFYPDKTLPIMPYRLFGSMTGCIVHCYDPYNNLYAMQTRGKSVKGAGKIQSAAAGFGKYGEELSQTALRELDEELGIEGKLILPHDVFLDVTAYSVNDHPQVLFSYITIADLANLTHIKDVKELENLNKKLKEGEVSHKFTIPLLQSDSMLDKIEKKIGFFGPIKKSAKSFLEWYAAN